MLVPTATDRFVRPARDDEAPRAALLWLRADDAVSIDDVKAARATRTDVALDDALAFAVAAAVKAPPTATNPASATAVAVPKTLASWLRTLIEEAARTAPFALADPEPKAVVRTRLVEDLLLRRLTAVARHGVVVRDEVAPGLGLSALDGARLFQALRDRTPRPDLSTLIASPHLPLVVTDDDAPPTAHEMDALRAKHPERLALLRSTSSIPSSLPEIDAVAAGIAPLHFDGVVGVFVQHVLGTQVPTFAAMVKKGLDPSRVVVVGVPYSTSHVAAEALRDLGFRVMTPELTDPLDLEDVVHAALEEALRAAVRLAQREGAPLLILDDGAKAAAQLHNEFGSGSQPIDAHIVEQTARGVTVLSQLPHIRWPVVDVARSIEKGHEQDKIGGEIVAAVVRSMARVGLRCGKGTRARVLGVGVIGTGVARAFKDVGCDVVVYDKDGQRRARARRAGFSCDDDRRVVLEAAEVVVGAAGATSFGAADLALVAPGCALASASSRNIEIDLSPQRDPRVLTKTLVIEGDGGGRFATRVWRLRDKDVVLLNNGFPMNFDGRVETGTNASIAPTRALMLTGAAQALSERTPGLHALRVIG